MAGTDRVSLMAGMESQLGGKQSCTAGSEGQQQQAVHRQDAMPWVHASPMKPLSPHAPMANA